MPQSYSLPVGSPTYPKTLGCWADSTGTGTPSTLRTPERQGCSEPSSLQLLSSVPASVTALRAPLMSRDQGPKVEEPRVTLVFSGSGDRLLDFMLRCYGDLTPSGFRQLALEAGGKMLIP